ncbi:tyrosine-type recombinase/integrase [Sphingomonas sp. CGMCC 1.13654]|uniref:Tyrosine-type recombinase/integrase n=1 Tax=Sphingomonas chungangi TaxID=2683589 RepID=A0A838LCT8_9SPHN|nr:site-specific integrase [Sphingomonas chungangi]MBA2935308.1 tyrosine-type recombinase/integrase [Sphingomonas chungangi]MVW56815.1 tyrosine-type recombinase/integrase [Sphingomonas chungangi]
MPKATLSPQFAMTATCPEGKKKVDYYCCGRTCLGLVLEVRSSGGRTWYLRFTDKYGSLRQMKIGRVEDVTWDQVKKTARKWRSEAVLGNDPAAQKAEAKAVLRYSELAARHIEEARTYARSIDNMDSNMRLHLLPRFGTMRLTEIDSRVVSQWLAEKRAQGLAEGTLVKLKALLGRSFELGARWGLAGCIPNPTRGIKMPRLDNARERFLTVEEAARLREAVAKSRNKRLPIIVGLLLCTGMRLMELLSAEWANVDLERRVLYLPKTKTKARYVPLSQAAIGLIGQIKRKKDARYLFPGRFDPKKHITSIKHSWDAARKEAGLSDVRLHDLRHSSASLMINSGIDLFTVGKVLGHSSYSSTQRYSHLANDTLIAAVEAGSSKLNWK